MLSFPGGVTRGPLPPVLYHRYFLPPSNLFLLSQQGEPLPYGDVGHTSTAVSCEWWVGETNFDVKPHRLRLPTDRKHWFGATEKGVVLLSIIVG